MTMDNPPFEDVFPIENGYFPDSHVSFLEGFPVFHHFFAMFQRFLKTRTSYQDLVQGKTNLLGYLKLTASLP